MTEVPEEHINAVDAFTFTLERDPLLRATIVALAVFDTVPDWAVLTERVDRATRTIPRFREKLVAVPLGLAPPRWVVDPDFDLGLHLRRTRLHEGAGTDDLLDMARTAGMTAFDLQRPLWEFTLVEGLPDARSALLMKLHHAMTDGVGGIQIAAHVVDLERTPPAPGRMPPAPTPRNHGLVDLVADTVGYHRRRVTDAVSDVARSAPATAAHAVAHPAATAAAALDTGRAIAKFVRPVTTTRSPIMTGRRPPRDVGTLDVDLDGLHDAAHRIGSTLNDAFLAGVAGGMRRYHDRHGAIVERLRISMPVNVRTEDDEPGGNRVTIERFDLPVGTIDPTRRMAEIGRICRELRQDPAIPFAGAIAGVLNLLPVDVTAGMLKHVDLLASNVAGFDLPVYVGGALVESFHVFGATLGSAANITLMSYAGTCHIGVTTDIGAVSDPGTFLECLREGFDEVIGDGATP